MPGFGSGAAVRPWGHEMTASARSGQEWVTPGGSEPADSRVAPYRVLVTGSRSWCASGIVYRALNEILASTDRPLVVVHGTAVGADSLASTWARHKGVAEERHPADWKRYNRAAGFRRNAEMVEAGADVCLAFIRDESRGATHCAGLAEKAGIPVRRFT